MASPSSMLLRLRRRMLPLAGALLAAGKTARPKQRARRSSANTAGAKISRRTAWADLTLRSISWCFGYD
jgi:hypothetical protein